MDAKLGRLTTAPCAGSQSRAEPADAPDQGPRRDVQPGKPLPPRHARGGRRRLDAVVRRRRAMSEDQDAAAAQDHRHASSARGPSSPATTRPTSRSRNRSTRIRAASTAASTATRADARLPRSVAGLDFETKLFAKPNAAALLHRRACEAWLRLRRDRAWAPTPIRTSRSSASGRSRGRSSRCLPRASIRYRSSPSRRWSSATSISSPPMAAKHLARVYVSITTLDTRAGADARAARRGAASPAGRGQGAERRRASPSA